MILEEFLVQAKQNTYAAELGGVPPETLEDGARQFVYREGTHEYRDRYYGFNPFGGEEIVREHGSAIWCMHYWGRVLTAEADPASVYRFLRSVLREVPKDRPFRGPPSFKDGPWSYRNQVSGDVWSFHGGETISYLEFLVYRCVYHGGALRPK